MEDLTGMFEEARFSRHDIDETMRAAAIEAVETVQGELGVLRAEAAAQAESPAKGDRA
jgi:hypothetical protein